MANQNFVVHNGLTVGQTQIFASNGDIISNGNITISGNLNLTGGGITVNQISEGSSAVSVNPTFVNIAANGTTVAVFNSTSEQINGYLNVSGNVLGSTATFNGLTVNGNESVTGYLNVSGNIIALTANVGQLGVSTNISAGGFINATGNILGSAATFTSGQFNSTTNATGINSGAVQLNGGMSVAKDLWVAGNVYAGNLVSVTTQVLTIQDSLLYLQNSNVYPYSYSIGLYGHYIGGPANTYVHSAITRQPNDSAWWFLSNIAEPNPVTGNINVYDANRILDTINTGAHNATGNITILNNYSLNVNPPTTPFSNAPVNATWNVNSFAQVNIQNTNSVGAQVSADFIATAPNGSDGSNYIDVGINGNNWSSGSWTMSGANDGYIYVDGGALTVGTDSSGKDLMLHSGGTLASSIKARIYDSAGNLTVFVPLNLSTNSNVNATASWINAGTVNITGNLLAATTTLGATTLNGTVTVSSGFLNSAGNVVATGGIFNALQVNGTTTTQIVQPDGDNTRTLGASGTRWSTVYGVTFSGTSTTANYADVAEKYLADADYEPGTVVMFGGEQEVTLADNETTRIAGVISTNPAHLMNDLLEGDNVVALALTGRVPCKVTGTIRKGDMLTSSGNGYAHANPNPAMGSVIGKALQDHDGLEGVIEVVVGRL